MLFQKVCAVDLGTDTIKIKDKNGKNFLYDKNVVALRNDRDILAVGSAAYEIYEKNPKNVQVVWPMTNGVIANLTEAEIVLRDTASGCNALYCRAKRYHAGREASLFPGHAR